jgi:hypothetical protein
VLHGGSAAADAPGEGLFTGWRSRGIGTHMMP